MKAAGQPERFTYQEYFTPGDRRSLRRFPALAARAFGIVWRSSPRELVVCAVMQVIIGVGLAGQLLAIRELLTDLLAPGDPSFSALLPELIVLTVIGAVVACAGALLEAQQRILGQLVALDTADGVIRTATGVELITYEEPGFHDRLQRAQLSAAARPAQLVNGLLGMGGALFAIVGVAFALFVVEPLFCLLVVAAFVPAWLATGRAGHLIYRYSVEQTERERRRLYLFGLLTGKEHAQEVRAFNLAGFLRARHRALFEELLGQLREVVRRRLRVGLAGQLVTALLSGGALALVVGFVTSGRMSLAEAGSAAAGMVMLSTRLRALATSGGTLYESALYLEDYVSFTEAAPRIEAARPTAEAPRDPQVVEAESVGFTYPSRTEPSLVDASLELRRGEVVALVGENGSGKTTFAKLLAGLYRPESGAISWDGRDTRELDPASLHDRVAVIFQDFVRYQLSAQDNIAMGEHARFDDMPAVERAAQAAGVHDAIAELRDGYDTLLGPEYYGGSNLSGGQWQRIALARAFFRDAPIVILDEPTASLDARAEASLYASMGDLFAGRGVLLISHRFGSVRSADRIYVLREGRVVEQGSHGELMDADGYYAELFRLQASRYVD